MPCVIFPHQNIDGKLESDWNYDKESEKKIIWALGLQQSIISKVIVPCDSLVTIENEIHVNFLGMSSNFLVQSLLSLIFASYDNAAVKHKIGWKWKSYIIHSLEDIYKRFC